MDRKEEYQNCIVFGGIEKSSRHGIEYWAAIKQKDTNESARRLFTEITFITRTAISMKYGDISDEEITQILSDLTFSKAKTRYTLDLFDEGKDYYQVINSETVKNEIRPVDDEYIQKMLLVALQNIRRRNPISYKEEHIIVDGFCSILGVSDNQYLFNASILLEDGLIREGNLEEMDIRNGGIFISSVGIRHLKNMQDRDIKQTTHLISNRTSQGGEISEEYKYDVALSFAGEERNIAELIASRLSDRNIRVFYDAFEQAELWGKNLYEHLSYVYSDAAKYCVILLSDNYSKKSWTNLERQNAQARAFREKNEYILPIRLDKTEIPGLPETVGYISLDKSSVNEEAINKIVELIIKKLMNM